MLSIALVLHILAAVIWVGGMFFMYVCLRPVLGVQLKPEVRLPFIEAVLARFFRWVWAAVIILPVTGFWLAFMRFGGVSQWPLYIHLMMALGILMILLYLHVFFAPWRRLKQALIQEDIGEAARRLDQIRKIIAANLTLGIVVIIIGAGGRFMPLMVHAGA